MVPVDRPVNVSRACLPDSMLVAMIGVMTVKAGRDRSCTSAKYPEAFAHAISV